MTKDKLPVRTFRKAVMGEYSGRDISEEDAREAAKWLRPLIIAISFLVAASTAFLAVFGGGFVKVTIPGGGEVQVGAAGSDQDNPVEIALPTTIPDIALPDITLPVSEPEAEEEVK